MSEPFAGQGELKLRPPENHLCVGFESKENPIQAIRSAYRVLLARRLYSRENTESEEYNRPHRNPVRGHVQQIGGIDQSADHDRESK